MKPYWTFGLRALVLSVLVPLHAQAATMADIMFSLTNWASCLDFRMLGPRFMNVEIESETIFPIVDAIRKV